MSLKATLIEAAVQVRDHAYAPYSRFYVGAAVQTRSGEIHTGTNVENASYGLTICAERSAISAAIAHGAQSGDITQVAIAIAAKHNGTPCGACRQVISEFASPDCQIVIMNLTSNTVTEYSLRTLLPDAFSGHSLSNQG